MVFLLAALAGCGEKQRREKDTGTVPECAEGWLADRGECVPESCGTGTWGELEVDESTVYVDIETGDGGDGSEGAPLRNIQAGLDLAGGRGGGLVAVAAGSYPETLEMGSDHAGVHLAGRCRELVVLDASVGDGETPGVDIDARYGEVEVSGMSVVGSGNTGVEVASGSVRLERLLVSESGFVGVMAYQWSATAPLDLVVDGCELVENNLVGVSVYGSSTEVTLVDTAIRDTRPSVYGTYGHGIEVHTGASLRVDGCELVGNTETGLGAADSGTEVTLMDSTFQDTLPDVNGGFGFGLLVSDGAAIRAEGCVLYGNAVVGIGAIDQGTEVTLVDTAIVGTQINDAGEYGVGIDVQGGAALRTEGCELIGNSTAAVQAYDPGTEVTIRDTEVRGTLPDGRGKYGSGINVQDGATLWVEGCELRGNATAGICASDTGTEATLVAVALRFNLPNEHGEGGYGIYAYEGAELLVVHSELEGNHELGVMANDAGTVVTLVDSVIRDTLQNEDGKGGYGVQVDNGARVLAESCELESNKGVGVLACDSGTEAVLLDTVIRGTLQCDAEQSGYGIAAYDGAALQAEGCLLIGNTALGIAAEGAGTEVMLVHTTVRDTLLGGSGEGGHGILVGGRAVLRAEGCELQGNSGVGLVAEGPGTWVELQDSSVTATMPGSGNEGGAATGITAQEGATVLASGFFAEGNEGPGLHVASEGSVLVCTNCVVIDNAFAGAVAHDAGTMEIHASTISGSRESVDLGGGVGIYAAHPMGLAPPSLLVTDSSISDNPVAGVWLHGTGDYRLEGVTVSGGNGVPHGGTIRCGDGIFATGTAAWDGGTGLSIEDSTISGNHGAGLFLDDATTQLARNTWSGNSPDLLVQGEACLSPCEEWAEVPISEICPAWDRPTCDLVFGLNLVLAEFDPAMPPPPISHATPLRTPPPILGRR